MAAKDHHTALRSEVVTRINPGYAEMILAKLQWGKDDTAFTLHIDPRLSLSAGLQLADWLAYLGFKRNERCQFFNARRCWSKEVTEGYSLEDFATAFHEGFGQLQKAEDGLQACGFWLPRDRELSPPAKTYRGELGGDGHTAISIKQMKQSEDDKFFYRFTFIETNRDKGFVTHYRPRHPPLSSEVQSVFKYLGLKQFDQCPEFEFEACHYRTLRLHETANPFHGNVEFAHKSFDMHAPRFATAVEALLAANATVERVGLAFLPIAKPKERLREDIVRHIGFPGKHAPPSKSTRTPDAALPSNFDVAISFAGSERELAEKLAKKLQAAGIAVFYDNFYPEHLWGKNLTAFLDEIYRKSAKYCVIFVSKEYRDRQWTNHELRSAQAKALELKGQEYILPVKVDDTELEGLPPNVGYVSISLGVDKIADMLIKKLQG
jgi:TIR domain